MNWRVFAFGAVLLWPMAAAAEDCSLTLIATIDMGIDAQGASYVPMTIGGKTVNLLIDTGGLDSTLTQSTVTSLGLATAPYSNRHAVHLIGGVALDRYAIAADIALGTLKAPELKMTIIPDNAVAPEINGTLGPNILRAYDEEFDFANAKLLLFSRDHCDRSPVHWTKTGYAVVQFEADEYDPHLKFPIEVNGHRVMAVLDTGSSRSVMSETIADLVGAKRAPKADVGRAGDLSQSARGGYVFDTLSFGGVAVTNPRIIVVPSQQWKLGDEVILGMSILRQLHFYIAYNTHKLYITAATAN